MNLRDRARGHWEAILAEAKIPADVLDGKHHKCPACGGKDRFRYLRDENGGFFCSDLRGNGIELLQHVLGVDFKGAAEIAERVVGKGDWKPERKEPTYAERLRAVAKPSPRSRYLESRGLEVPKSLRFAERVEYRDGDGNVIGHYAAMLAPVTRAGKFLTFHATYLDGGAKANVPTVRKCLPGPSLRGGAVELYPASETLGIAEGIETAIAAKMLHGVPVWSALNTSLLAQWMPPAGVKRVLIFADNDANFAGHAAAYALAHRLALRSIECEVRMPPPGDWNDTLLAQRSAA